MDATVNLYARMTRATQSLGLSEQQRLSIVETVNQAMVISGTSSAAASGALTQLGQALASGTLRGDEFNSIAEQAPVIMDMLSASLGKSRGELRAMAEQGQLTSEVLVGALLKGAEATQKQFDGMQLTIAGSSQQLANAFNELVGGTLDSSGATSAMAASISLLAMSLGTVIPVVSTVALAWGAQYVVGLGKAKLADVAKAASTANLARLESLAAVERARIQARDAAATQQVIIAARAQEPEQ
jgi:tape measure domain-containing protein